MSRNLRQYHQERLFQASESYPLLEGMSVGEQMELLAYNGELRPERIRRLRLIKDTWQNHSVWRAPGADAGPNWRLWLGMLAESLKDRRILLLQGKALNALEQQARSEETSLEVLIAPVSRWFIKTLVLAVGGPAS